MMVIETSMEQEPVFLKCKNNEKEFDDANPSRLNGCPTPPDSQTRSYHPRSHNINRHSSIFNSASSLFCNQTQMPSPEQSDSSNPFSPGSDFCLKHRRTASYGGEFFSNPTREIGEVAGLVVERAEDLMKTILVQSWRVVHQTKLPTWLKDNEYLIRGHRPQLSSIKVCFKSIFRIHTETGNIWTHLIGCLCFLLLCASFLLQPELDMPLKEKAIITIFFVSAILALAFSWLFHTLYCHSEHVGKLFSKLDYIGIALLIMGSFVPWLHFSFYCHQLSKIAYLSTILILGGISIIISTKERFATPKYRGCRAALFIALGLSGVVPSIHYLFLEGFWETVISAAIGYLVLVGFLYIFGAVIYAFRIPERLYPGKFDIWFQSHQIFHVCVVLAARIHFTCIMEIANSRLSSGECH